RYPMSPPNLATDAPVANVLQPLRVNFFPMPWKETDQVIAHHVERFLRLRITQKPLLAQTRLDRHFAALTEPDVVFVRLFFREQIRFRQQLRRFFPRRESVETVELWHCGAIDPAIRMQDVDDWQRMPDTDFEIERVMGGRDLENAGPELRIDRGVADDG